MLRGLAGPGVPYSVKLCGLRPLGDVLVGLTGPHPLLLVVLMDGFTWLVMVVVLLVLVVFRPRRASLLQRG